MSRKQWPIIAGGIGVAGAAALVSVLVLGGGDDAHDDGEPLRAYAASQAAQLERDHARALAEARIEAARQAAIEAAEQAEAAAEEDKREREAEEARQRVLQEARTQGVLGSAALTQGGAFASLTGPGDISSGFDDKNIYGGLLGDDVGDMRGGLGFGASGLGPGGGGTGWGTIGGADPNESLRRSGGGGGQGYSGGGVGMRGRRSQAPTVRTDVTQVIGELDKAIVRRYVRRYQPRITFCYEKQLLVEPGLAGTVTARFDIGEDGAITSSDASGMNEEVASCVAKALRTATFARPKSGTVSVTATFRMSPPPSP